MGSHNLQIGELVRLLPAISRNVSGGSYEIIKQLPERNGEYEYQIKSMSELHQRVVAVTRRQTAALRQAGQFRSKVSVRTAANWLACA
jgi:hypothetical protein